MAAFFGSKSLYWGFQSTGGGDDLRFRRDILIDGAEAAAGPYY
jgi:hypothetical protein